MQGVGNDESGTAESGIAARDGGCHDAEDCEDAADDAKPACADLLNNVGGREILDEGLAAGTVVLVEESLNALCVHHLAPTAIVEEIA